MARSLKFRIEEVEGLYYLCSENKGADQLRGYREADLRLFFAYAKSRFSYDAAHMTSGSGEDFLKVFNIYGRGGPCGHVT